MPDEFPTIPPELPAPETSAPAPVGLPAVRRFGSIGGAVIAWLVVIGVVVFWVAFMGSEGAEPGEAPVSRVGIQDELVGRIVVSFQKFEKDSGASVGGRALILQAEPLRVGTPAQRIAYAILIGEVDGAEKARDTLDGFSGDESESHSSHSWSDKDRALLAAVHSRLATRIAGGTVPALDADDADRLGYYSELLDGSASPSVRAVVTVVLAGGWYLIFGLSGLLLLLLCATLAALGKLRAGCSPPSRLGRILIETFAVWMCLFFGMQTTAFLVADSLGDSSLRILIAPVMFFGSLLALFWPRLRGVSWSETRRAIGWRSDGIAGDAGWGVLGYSMALPLLGLGLLVALMLSAIVGAPPNASHPAIERIAKAGPLGLANLFFLACIAAPIVEETMFRGVLYRHLRDATGGAVGSGVARAAMTVVSVLVSAVVSSAIFAAIHPQGLIFAPVLAGLACGFCLVREWRGSVFPGMLAHGIANFVTLSLNVGLQGWLGW